MIKKIYVGLNDNYHDPSICIIDDQGNILFAEGVERFLQYKRGLGLSADSDLFIEKIFNQNKFDSLEKVIICSSWLRKTHVILRLISVSGILNFSNNSIFYKALHKIGVHRSSYLRFIKQSAALNQSGAGINHHLSYNHSNVIIIKKYASHHLTHITTALNSSNITSSIGLVIDGGGDSSSISLFKIKDGVIEFKSNYNTKINLGNFYSSFTFLLNLSSLKGEEWKIMGLSAYGKLNENLYSRLLHLFPQKKITSSRDLIQLKELIKSQNIPSEDVAFTAQYRFEEYFFEIIHWAKKLLPDHENIIISGGSALNSLAIGKLHESGLFKKVIVPNAPADDGNSIGAALLAYQKDHPTFNFAQTNQEARSPYLGNEISESDLLNYFGKSGLPFKKIENPTKYAAELLHQNKIIGWIQGRAEFGPRALGNRSILANPCFAENKDRINAVVKFRESFRPFAPSILHEYGEAYFSKYDFTPYMEKTLTFREEVRTKVPAVVHVDGTGRLQSVTTEINPKFHALISEFNALSGVPIVVNTSYNVMGKPIVNDINDVMAVFFNSQLDAVIIHDYVLERPFHFV